MTSLISLGIAAPPPARRRRQRLLAVVITLLAVGAMVAGIVWATSSGPSGVGDSAGPGSPLAEGASELSPEAQQGDLATPAALTDTELPAIARLDPELHAALVDAAIVAASDGIVMEITSGWRSREYQQRIFDEAVAQYGSVDVARQWVATPDTSAHVTGDAVDVGPLDAQFWLIEHGSMWGLCQIYANERWHFELATTPGGSCPELRADAAG